MTCINRPLATCRLIWTPATHQLSRGSTCINLLSSGYKIELLVLFDSRILFLPPSYVPGTSKILPCVRPAALRKTDCFTVNVISYFNIKPTAAQDEMSIVDFQCLHLDLNWNVLSRFLCIRKDTPCLCTGVWVCAGVKEKVHCPSLKVASSAWTSLTSVRLYCEQILLK